MFRHRKQLLILSAFVLSGIPLLFGENLLLDGGEAASTKTLSEKYYIVKVYDRTKALEYRVVSSSEFKKLDQTISLEKRFHSKAIMDAQKKWREDETNESTYPRGCVTPRKMTKSGRSYKEQNEAFERLEKLQEEEEIRKKVKEQQERTRAVPRVTKPAPTDVRGKIRAQEKAKAEAEEARRKEAEAILASARDLYDECLRKIITEYKKRRAN